MGYTVWHDVAPRGAIPTPRSTTSCSARAGSTASCRRTSADRCASAAASSSATGSTGSPVATLSHACGSIARAAGVRFGGAIVVLPDDDVLDPIDELGKVRGTPVAVVSRSALSTVLRRGITGAREVGGNEVFDVRTRLQQAVRHV